MPGGTVRVSVHNTSDHIEIVISDTGIGMAPADIPRALSTFGQIDSAQARKYAGSGLGLPLAKRLAELHGGVLELDSILGRGTTATVRLPQAIMPEAEQQPNRRLAAATSR